MAFMARNLQPIVADRQQLNRVFGTRTLQPVVAHNKEQTRAAFSKRLNAVLDEVKDCPARRGRRQWVAKRYGVSVESARKWLTGEDMPDGTNSARIAADLGINDGWLRSGVGPMRPPVSDAVLDELTRTWPSLDTSVRLEILRFVQFRKTDKRSGT